MEVEPAMEPAAVEPMRSARRSPGMGMARPGTALPGMPSEKHALAVADDDDVFDNYETSMRI